MHLSHVATEVTEASGSLGTRYGHIADDHWGWKHGHPGLRIHIPSTIVPLCCIIYAIFFML